MIEEFELDEFLSSQINWLKYEILKVVYKHNTYVQKFCWISRTLNLEQKRNTESSCECVIYVVIYFPRFEVVSRHVAAEDSVHLFC
jgi:hypothetical protein